MMGMGQCTSPSRSRRMSLRPGRRGSRKPTSPSKAAPNGRAAARAFISAIPTVISSNWRRQDYGRDVRAEKSLRVMQRMRSQSTAPWDATRATRRADAIIVDDPHDIRDDLEEIERTIGSFTKELMSRLNDRKSGRVLVIAHRVAPFCGNELSHRIERAPELARSFTRQGANAFARPQFRSAGQAGSPVRDQVLGPSNCFCFGRELMNTCCAPS